MRDSDDFPLNIQGEESKRMPVEAKRTLSLRVNLTSEMNQAYMGM